MPYLQKALTDSIKNPALSDIQAALSEVLRMDEEHSGFRAGSEENDIVLEVQKDRTMALVICGEICRE